MNKYLIFNLSFLLMYQTSFSIFDFTTESDISSWRIVDDVVMGGVSQGNFKIKNEGNGLYSGQVSLENNGGFSSLRYRSKEIKVANFSKVVLRVKGDGKNYQFRIKDRYRNYYSYIKVFNTTKDWQNIEINLADMYPAFRGRVLDMDNFSAKIIEEIAILIGNKKAQNFQLEIDTIYLK